ncbi:TetR family transcriptional regulator [Enterococcus florum]|uniref:TetR family transcriptional regulator n=1 Tax=Enterococcus florum TaxID=2480627 RepID=A0A4P5P5L5_9ENTE|nr:TetR/AcrR family transcriptional regulator [Enterococcus florum]GCF92736.1 TetR family transcriptional regulator [Enterococcus florum]
MDKKEIILDALRELFKEGKAGTASVSDIAKKAGIAKGGLYYYFRSKEEVLDALVMREYEDIIQACKELVEQSNGNALQKLALLLKTYRNSYVDTSLDEYLHMPQNAAIHQKSLAQILSSLSQIISRIIEQGIEENTFICEYPQEYAEILMSVFTFLLDPGIFPWTAEQYVMKLKALADMLEKGLRAPKDSFAFLYSNN